MIPIQICRLSICRNFFEELDDVRDIIFATKEYRAALMDTGGLNIKNTPGPGRRNTSGLIHRQLTVTDKIK